MFCDPLYLLWRTSILSQLHYSFQGAISSLRRLTLNRFSWIPSQLLPTLTHLHLYHVITTLSRFLEVTASCLNLEYLVLEDCWLTHDVVQSVTATRTPNLHHLVFLRRVDY